MSTELVVAVVGGAFGLGGAITTALLGQHQSRVLAHLNANQAERDARREYEYESLKRMYEAYEPVRFQLVDAAGAALRRISEISGSNPETRLDSPAAAPGGYYLKATVYHLLAPVALVRLMDQRLTLVDLRLSAEISNEYAIAKAIARSFSDDSLVATFKPPLEYAPWGDGGRQGLPPGLLENAADALLVRDESGQDRLMSFAQFETHFDELDPDDVDSELGAARDLFDGFDPISRPVLWRLLVSQVLLYGCYLTVAIGGSAALAKMDSLADDMVESLTNAVHNDRRLDLYWDGREAPGRNHLDNDIFEAAFPIARKYYEWRVAPAVVSVPAPVRRWWRSGPRSRRSDGSA